MLSISLNSQEEKKKEKKEKKKKCPQLEPEFAVLSQEMGEHLVPADFLLNFILF